VEIIKMTYVFKIIETGELVEVELKMSEYDLFKKSHPELERYFEPVPFNFEGRVKTVPTQVTERLRRIEATYPGAKGMLKNSKFHHNKEW
jgi:hypothetical protein